MWHEPVELVPAFVPLDAVQLVPAQVVAAGEVRGLALLDELGNANTQIRQTVDHWKESKRGRKGKLGKFLERYMMDIGIGKMCVVILGGIVTFFLGIL